MSGLHRFLLFFIAAIGLLGAAATALIPNDDADKLGVFFSPRLSNGDIMALLSKTNLKVIAFTGHDNVIVVSGDREILETATLQDHIWFIFNPAGFKSCGVETTAPVF